MNQNIFNLFVLLLLFSIPLKAQSLKTEAIKEMQNGRYGEAINLLNRYISANPQEPEGYNLRGLCFEKRSEYELAVYDFRSAKKIKPDDKEIIDNLTRSVDAWNKLLYNKVEGYNREIALNPKSPVNYLEIGRCYKNLGEWEKAELWYDKYLKMEAASPDEIIRYTEILVKTHHTARGLSILKKYTDKYPQDHRIWSRYGFYALWEGKTKIAKEAFEKALALRPYFKEAMDGLDQANGKGYSYTINDTTSFTKKKTNKIPQEYAIDKYYRMIKENPDDIESRFALTDELIKNKRIEEASDQLNYMQEKGEDSTKKFQEMWDYVTAYKDSIYKQDVIVYTELFEKSNKDKEAVIKLSNAYAHLYDYDNAILVLETYLSNFKNNEELDLRYLLTKYCAWTYQWNKAFIQCNILLDQKPEDKDYQLLMAQLIAWNIIDAKPEEVERAEKYLFRALEDDPKNMTAILSLAFIYSGIERFPEAMKYIELARTINPSSKELISVENTYNTRFSLSGEKKVLRLRAVAGKLAEEGNCKGAYDTYKEIMAEIENPERSILIEYATFCTCAKEYESAINAYDKILEEEYDYEIACLRDINILLSGDTLKALQEFLSLKEKAPYNYSLNFYLGDIYEKIKQPDKAKDLYRSILEASSKDSTLLDSTQIAGFQTRLKYLSSTFSSSLPLYIGLAPLSVFYSDNQNFSYNNIALRGDISLFGGFSVGATLGKYNLMSSISNTAFNRNLSTFQGHLSFNSGYFFASAGLGKTSTDDSQSKMNSLMIRLERANSYLLSLSYETNDARILLLAPNIINLHLKTSLYNLRGNFASRKFLVNSYFNYINISDGNVGNDFQFRTGIMILPEIKTGYEYYYSNYSFSPEYYFQGKRVSYYYAPKKFQSHSLWGDFKIFNNDKFNFSVGGKLGFVTESHFLIEELYGEGIFNLFKKFALNGRLSAGKSSRNEAIYSYFSIIVGAYLSIF